MPRGGPRSGTPGKGYANRTDLLQQRQLPASAAQGQPYGAAKAQMDAQRAVPMATPPITPGGLPPLDAPTQRPAEPVTAGAPLGPGPGPEALAAVGVGGDDLDELRALYQRYPQYDELREIIEEIEEGGF